MYLKVIAVPSAKKEKAEEKGEALMVSVKEPASGNHANQRIREIVAARFGAPVGKVQVLSGHRSRSKMISIASL